MDYGKDGLETQKVTSNSFFQKGKCLEINWPQGLSKMLLLVQKWFNSDRRAFQAETSTCKNPEFEDMFGGTFNGLR